MSANNVLLVIELPKRDGALEWRLYDVDYDVYEERHDTVWCGGRNDEIVLYLGLWHRSIERFDDRSSAIAFAETYCDTHTVEYWYRDLRLDFPYPTDAEVQEARVRWKRKERIAALERKAAHLLRENVPGLERRVARLSGATGDASNKALDAEHELARCRTLLAQCQREIRDLQALSAP